MHRLGIAVDVVLFTVNDGELQVLLTRRNAEPFAERWALPGGFIADDESADEAAHRQLETKAGVRGVYLEQLYTFSAPDRDPRSRVVSVAYFALVSADRLGDRGTREPAWFPIGTEADGALRVGAPSEQILLAFDHAAILSTALARIRGKLDYAPIGFQLLPERFTLSDIQAVYEAILGRAVDKRNFRSKLLRSGLVRESKGFRTGAHRPARLFEFTDRTF